MHHLGWPTAAVETGRPMIASERGRPVMKITAVRCFRVAGSADYPAAEERQLQMLDVYPELASRPPAARTPGGRLSATYVEVASDEGPSGLFGPIFDETAPLIQS